MKVPSGWAALPLEIGPRNIQWKIVWRVHASSSGHRQPLTDPRFGLRHFMSLKTQMHWKSLITGASVAANINDSI
eukprot:scaffold110715_cov20-Tisochrysis_lutea.AAC.1